MSESVLVTGGTGFTGSHLCEHLARKGYHVKTIVRKPESATRLQNVGVEIIPGDITDSETAMRATKCVNKVYHLAALYRQEGGPRRAFWDVNVTGTENLLRASVLNDVCRFIHCSTVGVHGHIEAPPAAENAPYRPGDAYQESKLEGEKIALRFMERRDLGVTIFRPSGIYGPGDLRFLKLFRAIYRGSFWMIGTGNVLYHLTYIDDLIDGILACGNKEAAAGGIYILAGEEYVALSTLVSLIAQVLDARPCKKQIPVWPVYLLACMTELICKPLGLEPPLYRRRVDFFRKSRAFDITKAKTELGFSPCVDLKTGLRRTADWYRQNGYL